MEEIHWVIWKGSPQKVAVWEGKSPYFREIMVKTPEPSTVASTRRPSQKETHAIVLVKYVNLDKIFTYI